MKNRVKYFGHVFPIKFGIHKGKFQYCYKDKNGLNQHSKPFKLLSLCSQEFAETFAKYIVNGMVSSINNKQEC